MGAAGSAQALEAADIALMSDDLTRLPFLLRLSRATYTIIGQNIALSLLLKLGFLALAVGGWANLWAAVIADVGASLLVTANGMRLMGFRKQ
jgi:Cd2+/Zn2+-exporting ATPase